MSITLLRIFVTLGKYDDESLKLPYLKVLSEQSSIFYSLELEECLRSALKKILAHMDIWHDMKSMKKQHFSSFNLN